MDLSLSIPENSIHRPTRRHDDSPTLEGIFHNPL